MVQIIAAVDIAGDFWIIQNGRVLCCFSAEDFAGTEAAIVQTIQLSLEEVGITSAAWRCNLEGELSKSITEGLIEGEEPPEDTFDSERAALEHLIHSHWDWIESRLDPIEDCQWIPSQDLVADPQPDTTADK